MNYEIIDNIFEQLQEIFHRGHIADSEFQTFTTLLDTIYPFTKEEYFNEKFKSLIETHSPLFSKETMQGLAYTKPYGYAGDFEIIDKIYTKWKSNDTRLKTWDEYFHSQPASVAVRNRKTYYKNLLKQIANKNNQETITILNLASGSCRDLKEFFEENKDTRFHFDCVELDKNAIIYATNLLADNIQNVSFINHNIYKYVPVKTYDLIWSAGLFDYFDDTTFVRILSRYIKINDVDQKVVIGNFTDENPTKSYMEIIGQWFLHHRGKDRLKKLALMAGSNIDNIKVEEEEAKVNLFLHIN
jgi:extracellular factor (EF) 3-hydroxypalmitic acid methyl ester biosynthesis protein